MDSTPILELEVEPTWIDYNGHMNVAYYVVAFDHAVDAFLDCIGMHAAYRDATGCTNYTLELHVNYLREVKVHEPLAIHMRVVDYDAKRLHCFARMIHSASGELAATMEQLLMHMDATAVRATPMPAPVLERVKHAFEADRELPLPEQLGARIAIRHR